MKNKAAQELGKLGGQAKSEAKTKAARANAKKPRGKRKKKSDAFGSELNALVRPLDKLEKLLSLCKCGVFLTVNQHRDYYETAQDWFKEHDRDQCPPEVSPDVRRVMIETDTVIEIHFYPNTPVGFYVIHHHDLSNALDEALQCLA